MHLFFFLFIVSKAFNILSEIFWEGEKFIKHNIFLISVALMVV